MEQLILELLMPLVAEHPIAASVLGVIGFFRVIFKPLMSLVRAVIGATVTKKDDEALVKVEASKAYKFALFLLDYLVSIKLPAKK